MLGLVEHNDLKRELRFLVPLLEVSLLHRNLLKTIVMGQVLSLLICGTAVSSQYLVLAGVETPMLQSFLNYVLLLLIYTTLLSTRKGLRRRPSLGNDLDSRYLLREPSANRDWLCRVDLGSSLNCEYGTGGWRKEVLFPLNVPSGDRNIGQVLRTKWWKYLIMGVADVEANYAVVKAYQFTSLTSIQVLLVLRAAGGCCWSGGPGPDLRLALSAAGLLRHPGPHAAVLVHPEDPLPARPLCSRAGVSAGGGGHGGG